jgi:hypothetical protein
MLIDTLSVYAPVPDVFPQLSSLFPRVNELLFFDRFHTDFYKQILIYVAPA